MAEVSFYDVGKRTKVSVPRSQVKLIYTKRGQPCLTTTQDGRKLFKFIKRANVNEYESSNVQSN